MPPKHIFKSITFVLSGKLSQTSKEYKDLIVKHGGDVLDRVTGSVDYLISTEDDVKAGTTKVAAALEKDIPIIQEGFIGACILAKKVLDVGKFLVSKKRKAAGKPRAKGAPTAKVARKAAVPADAKPVATTDTVEVIAKSGLADKASVVVEDVKKGFVKAIVTWDVELVLHDVAAGKDKFYNMQLLASKEGGEYWAVQNWGRTGLAGAVHIDGPYAALVDAKKVFKKKYRSKTGNVFGSVGESFVEVGGKYKVLAPETEPADGEAEAAAGGRAEAPKREAPGKWQYYLHNKVDGKKLGWYDYDAGANANMEKFWKQCGRDPTLSVRLIQSDYFKYEVHFTEHWQRNIKSGMRRAIRRLAAGEVGTDEKPEEIPEAAAPAPDWKAAPSSDEEDPDEDGDSSDEEEAEEAEADAGEADAGEADAGEAEPKEEPKPAGRAPPPEEAGEPKPAGRAPPADAEEPAPAGRAPPEDKPAGRAPPPGDVTMDDAPVGRVAPDEPMPEAPGRAPPGRGALVDPAEAE